MVDPDDDPPPDDELEEVWFGFISAHARIARALDASLAATHGMPIVEYEVLFKLLRHGGPMRMSELAEVALFSRSGLTRVVDELCAQGLVTRTRDPTDGRGVLADLTPAGRRTVASARRAHLATVRRLFFDALSPAQRRALASAWRAVHAALDADESSAA